MYHQLSFCPKNSNSCSQHIHIEKLCCYGEDIFMPIMCIFAVIVRNCVTTVNVFLFLNIHVLVALDELSVPGYMYYLLGDKKNANRMQITAKRDGEVLRNA